MSVRHAALKKTWAEKAKAKLEGRTIKAVRYLMPAEQEALGWFRSSLVLFLDDGSYLFPSADDEGNDAGALFTSFEDLETIPVI